MAITRERKCVYCPYAVCVLSISDRQKKCRHCNAKLGSQRMPTYEEVKNFAKENSLEMIADKFYRYYKTSNFLDVNGDPLQWKQKLLAWGNREGMLSNQTNFSKKSNFTSRKYTDEQLNSLFQSIDDIDI